MADDNKPARDQTRTPATQNAFLERVRNSRAEAQPSNRDALVQALRSDTRPRLLFSMDATASREPSWDIAKEITQAMFAAVPGALEVALAYHGGGALREVTPFASNARVFLDKVHQVACVAGPTALNEVLEAALDLQGLKALIYIGDFFEEDAGEAKALATQLKLKGVPCFMFHEAARAGEGLDPYLGEARDVFGMIAQLTGGVLLPFDATAPDKVQELLEAIAMYAVGGIKLLEQQARQLPAAKLLLEQLNR